MFKLTDTNKLTVGQIYIRNVPIQYSTLVVNIEILLLSVKLRKHKIEHYSVSIYISFLLYFLMQILITFSTLFVKGFKEISRNFLSFSIEKREREDWRHENQNPD